MIFPRAQNFVTNVKGTIAPLFGLSALVLMLVVGVAIDGSRAFQASSEVRTALDAAAMAAAKEMRNNADATDQELEDLAVKYFQSNLEVTGGVGVVYDQLTLDPDRDGGSITLSVDTRLPTTFARLLSIEKIDIPKSATAVDGTREIEMSMMLDLSGSMRGSRISDLQVAAAELVDIVLGANSVGGKTRIAIAPYSSAVNAGEFAARVTGQSGSNKCVTERSGANAFKDEGPAGGYLGTKASYCPGSKVVPLTDDKTKLTSHIGAMAANGATAGHLGIAWSWYLVSPKWASIWPADSEPNPYSSDVMKVALIMSDGDFNASYESGNGSSKTQGKNLCDGMKASGITVYAVSFQAPASAIPVLKHCASSDNHFFDARDGANLLQSFREIARRLSLLRLSS